MESTNDDAVRKSYGTTTKQHYTTSTHTAAKQLHVQDASTTSNEHSSTTTTAPLHLKHTAPHSHNKLTHMGQPETQVQQPQTSPYTQNTAYTTQTKAPTNTAQQTATPKQTHTAPKHTSSTTYSTTTDIHTNFNTDHSNTHTPTAAHVVPTHVAVSDEWTATADCYDSNTNLGGPIYRTIQATSWSRRRGLHGQDPLQVPFAALARYGAEDYAVRLLSQGKFTGVVATRTAAESVFCKSVGQIIEGSQHRS